VERDRRRRFFSGKVAVWESFLLRARKRRLLLLRRLLQLLPLQVQVWRQQQQQQRRRRRRRQRQHRERQEAEGVRRRVQLLWVCPAAPLEQQQHQHFYSVTQPRGRTGEVCGQAAATANNE
jgi:hypothetical protein